MIDAIVHLRVPAATKARWVRQSRAAGMRLTDWIVQRVDGGEADLEKFTHEVSEGGTVPYQDARRTRNAMRLIGFQE